MKSIVTSLVLAAAFTVSIGAFAKTPPPAAKSPHGDMMGGHQEGGMKADCKAMTAKKQEMQDKLKAMDATLDKLVAEMNAAKTDTRADAMEKPMAAVLTELVAQRKASRSMMEQMHAEMMEHMSHHMGMGDSKDGMKGMHDCPMMKMGDSTGTEKPPSM